MKKPLWLGTAAIGGAVLMGLEMVGFRLYAPYFGYSTYVWGSMISVIMAAMACGYWFGGRLADRSKDDAPLYIGLLIAAAYQLLLLLTSGILLTALADMGEFAGAGLATLLIFGVPTTLLAGVSPFVVRLMALQGSVGGASGAVSAVSTMGSILGILATTYFLVPSIGTQETLRCACALTAILSVVGLFAGRRRVMGGLAAALFTTAVALPMAPLWLVTRTPGGKVVWISESAYNLVRVVRYGRYLLLTLNDDRMAHSMRHDRSSWTGGYHDMFALGPLLAPAHSLVVLGLGAGSSVATTRLTAPAIEVDAVEVDPKVVDAGRYFFGLAPREPLLRVHIADARRWLTKHPGTFDIAHVDLFQGGPYIPSHLVTTEFFQQVHAHLSPEGLLMNNVFDPSVGQELLHTIAATLGRVFPSVFILSDGRGSHMLFAFATRQSEDLLRRKIASAVSQVSGPGVKLVQHASGGLKEFHPRPGTAVFTDDLAPIESMTRRMIAEYHRKLRSEQTQ